MPILFVPKETTPGETRVAATPETVKALIKLGFQVHAESGAGVLAGFIDAAYQEAGATLTREPAMACAQADVTVKLHPPREGEAEALKEGALLVAFIWPAANPALMKTLAARKVTAFAMDRIPRISRAQNMDALSSQANIAGYKSVIMAAEALGKMFPLLMTAAGTITPARVVIMGAGVAGLQAIATAKRLGALVEVSDIRPSVKTDVESLGAKFIDVPTDPSLQDKGGYAKEVSPEFLKKQQEIIRQRVVAADVVITTAQVPGKAAPRLVTAEMVQAMRPGSVIVDLAAEQGGNCELTEAGKVAVKHGVTLIGKTNIPGTVPLHASEMYSKNVLNVLRHLYPKNEYKLDFKDEITAGSVVTHGGETKI